MPPIDPIPTNSPLRDLPDDYSPEGAAHWYRLTEGLDAGKTLFYYDHVVGDQPPRATVLFVHGNPECSYTYRHIRDALIASGQPLRLVAMDHIGFGVSDQADFEMVDFHHARNVAELVRHLDLRNITLVIHDWGGPIGVGAFLDEPDRVDNLLLMNTAVFPMPATGYTYANWPIPWLPWCRTPHVVPDRLWGGVAAYVVSHAEPQSRAAFLWGVTKYLLKHELGQFEAGSPQAVWSDQMRSAINARSSQRNVLQTPVWGHGYRYHEPRHGEHDNHDFYRRIHEMVPSAWGEGGRNIGVAGYFGAWDPCGKDEVIDQWRGALPRLNERLYRYPDHGHFIEEYKGPEMARSILGMTGLDNDA